MCPARPAASRRLFDGRVTTKWLDFGGGGVGGRAWVELRGAEAASQEAAGSIKDALPQVSGPCGTVAAAAVAAAVVVPPSESHFLITPSTSHTVPLLIEMHFHTLRRMSKVLSSPPSPLRVLPAVPHCSQCLYCLYCLGTRQAVVAYDLVSANDSPERDPCDWVVEAAGEGAGGPSEGECEMISSWLAR